MYFHGCCKFWKIFFFFLLSKTPEQIPLPVAVILSVAHTHTHTHTRIHTKTPPVEDGPTWRLWTLYDPVWLGAGRTPSPSPTKMRGGEKNSVIKPWVMSGSYGWHPPLLSPALSNCFHSVFSCSLPPYFSLPPHSPLPPSLNPSSHFSFTPFFSMSPIYFSLPYPLLFYSLVIFCLLSVCISFLFFFFNRLILLLLFPSYTMVFFLLLFGSVDSVLKTLFGDTNPKQPQTHFLSTQDCQENTALAI